MTLQERKTIKQYFEELEAYYIGLSRVAQKCSHKRLENEYLDKAALMPKIWIGLWKRTEITEE